MADADALFADAAARLHAGDVAGARDLFGRAAAAGRRDAAAIHCNLVAQADWPRGLALLRALAPADRLCRRQLETLEAMDLAADGAPSTVPEGEPVSISPHVTRFGGLFTPAECRYLAEAATPMLEPSVVVDRRTGRQLRDPVRTSDSVGFTLPLENPAVHALNRRIAAAAGVGVDRGEPLQVLRYRPGQQYRPHLDAIPGFANQRIMTMLVWLNEDYEGGETLFMKTGLRLRGGIGDAILFRNVDAEGRRDEATAHAGLPVTRGEKLLASRWIRARAFSQAAEAAR